MIKPTLLSTTHNSHCSQGLSTQVGAARNLESLCQCHRQSLGGNHLRRCQQSHGGTERILLLARSLSHSLQELRQSCSSVISFCMTDACEREEIFPLASSLAAAQQHFLRIW